MKTSVFSYAFKSVVTIPDNKISKRFQKTFILCIMLKYRFFYDENVFNSRE